MDREEANLGIFREWIGRCERLPRCKVRSCRVRFKAFSCNVAFTKMESERLSRVLTPNVRTRKRLLGKRGALVGENALDELFPPLRLDVERDVECERRTG